MKKNVMMRVASIMLVLVLMSSSVISGTFAKYVTEGTGTDTARVAKFGVVVNGDSDIFDAEYTATESGLAFTYTVQATENVVAPGTTKNMANVGITGTPEVAVRISNTAVFEIGDNWMVDADNNNVQSGAAYVRDTFYCPIVVTVVDAEGTTHNLCGLDYDNAEAFEGAVEYVVSNATADYAPNTNLATVQDIQLTWTWAFAGTTEGGTGHAEQLNKYDTQLGDQAAFLTPATISVSVTTIVTQID